MKFVWIGNRGINPAHIVEIRDMTDVPNSPHVTKIYLLDGRQIDTSVPPGVVVARVEQATT